MEETRNSLYEPLVHAFVVVGAASTANLQDILDPVDGMLIKRIMVNCIINLAFSINKQARGFDTDLIWLTAYLLKEEKKMLFEILVL